MGSANPSACNVCDMAEMNIIWSVAKGNCIHPIAALVNFLFIFYLSTLVKVWPATLSLGYGTVARDQLCVWYNGIYGYCTGGLVLFLAMLPIWLSMRFLPTSHELRLDCFTMGTELYGQTVTVNKES